jgi:hypothetical protein
MYIARFSYFVAPVDRKRAVDLIRQEVEAATARQMKAKLLVPLTRASGEAALQFEVELAQLDQLESFRECGLGSAEKTREWIEDFSEILVCPPEVELLRVDGA